MFLLVFLFFSAATHCSPRGSRVILHPRLLTHLIQKYLCFYHAIHSFIHFQFTAMYSQLGSQLVFWGLLLQSLSERQEFNLDNHAQILISLHANYFQINVISSLAKQRNTTQLFIPLSVQQYPTVSPIRSAYC